MSPDVPETPDYGQHSSSKATNNDKRKELLRIPQILKTVSRLSLKIHFSTVPINFAYLPKKFFWIKFL